MALINRADLEAIFTVRLVRNTFADDGGIEPGPRLAIACQTASDQLAAILGKVENWRSEEALQELIDEDASVRLAACQLAMAVGAEAKAEWMGGTADSGPAVKWRTAARQTLNDLITRATRSRAENRVGANTVNLPRVANARQFEFSGRRGKDSSGGF